MNFNKIPPVPSTKFLLDLAFRRAREKANVNPKVDSWLQRQKIKESSKLDIVKDILVTHLQGIINQFPQERDLPVFYLKLIHLTLEYPQYKKSFGALKWAQEKVKFFQKEYVSKINKTHDVRVVRKMSQEFYGRISSIARQINASLTYLEECRRMMRTYPDVKEMFTVCIYGFPNVGKTTLLNALTGSRAKVASYAFTTLSINSGFMAVQGQQVQVLDVPGILNRSGTINLIEQQAELVLEELADIIIYVFDLSEQSGYSLKKQEQLFQQVKHQKNVLIYVSKNDVTDAEVLAGFSHRYYTLEGLREELGKVVSQADAAQSL